MENKIEGYIMFDLNEDYKLLKILRRADTINKTEFSQEFEKELSYKYPILNKKGVI